MVGYKGINTMKKFICLFLFSFLLSSLFAKDFIICDHYYLNKNPHQIVFLTQVKNDDQYSVMVVSKNQNEDLYHPLYIMSFHSQTENYKAYEKAKNCFKNIESFIKEHNFERGRISNSSIDFGDFKIKIDNSRPFMYNDFQK